MGARGFRADLLNVTALNIKMWFLTKAHKTDKGDENYNYKRCMCVYRHALVLCNNSQSYDENKG